MINSYPMNIPLDMNVTYNGVDTVINDMFESDLKFVVYADSVDCISCGINKMHMWMPFIKFSKLYNGKIKFYFIFHPTDKSINNIKTSFKQTELDYPMLIDKNGDFEKLNPHLPKNKALHTFLLDENNKVILVGNPLYNKDIEKLFYKITQEKLGK